MLLSAFLISAALAAAMTPLVARLAKRARLLDIPDESRKQHRKPTPLFGGAAVIGSVFVTVALLIIATEFLPAGAITRERLAGLALASAVLLLGGFLDDRYRLRPSRQIIFPILAAGIAVASGVGIDFIGNPFGGDIRFDLWKVGALTLPADAITFLWLLGMMYTTKLLDGLDGLVTGMTAIGAGMIVYVAMLPHINQPETALLAAIFAGALVGFLPWNFHPARIFLGESGSLFAGFFLGVLAVISGSKVATTILVMAVPVFDVAWVISRRIARRRPLARGDREHIHFRLLDAGFSHRRAVLLLWITAAFFGALGLFFQTREHIPGLGKETVEIELHGNRIAAELADRPQEWMRGLSGRDILPEGRGMLFRFSRAEVRTFWMKDMRFPIDIIWIRDGVVIGIDANVPAPAAGESPTQRTSPEPVDAVLEVPAGFAAEAGIIIGASIGHST
ncbi:MAG: DUF192 domain-containing protein [Patescibacteria group bacterium]